MITAYLRPAFLFAVMIVPALAAAQSAAVKSAAAKPSTTLQQPKAELAEVCVFDSKKGLLCSTVGSPLKPLNAVRAQESTSAPTDPKAVACAWMPTGSIPSGKSPDPAQIARLLASPFPFGVVAQGNSLLVYRMGKLGGTNVGTDLTQLNQEIATLYSLSSDIGADKQVPGFTAMLHIPHAAALGDLATLVQSLNFSGFTAQDVGKDMVRVTAAAGVKACDWADFVDALHRLVWSVHPDSPVTQVFYYAASDVSTALAGTNAAGTPVTLTSSFSPSAAGGAAGAGASASSGSSATGTPASSGSSSSSPSAAGSGGTVSGSSTPAASSTSASSTGGNSATVSISQPAGTSTTLNMVTAAAGGSANGLPVTTTSSGSAAAGSPAPGASGTSGASASPVAAGASAAAKATVTQAALGPSDLIFSDTTNGDDAAITERKRIVASVDLPQPEMMINTWILQQSTSDPKLNQNIVDELRRMVNLQNDGLTNAITYGWNYLDRQIKSDPAIYFYLPFYNYVVPRVMFSASLYETPPAAGSLSLEEIANRALRDEDVPRKSGRLGVLLDHSSYGREMKGALNDCPVDRYCLGFNTIFQPLQPNLTTLLLALIAANDPAKEANESIEVAEANAWNSGQDCESCYGTPFNSSPRLKSFSSSHASNEAKRREAWKELVESVRRSLDLNLEQDHIEQSSANRPIEDGSRDKNEIFIETDETSPQYPKESLRQFLLREPDCTRADQRAVLRYLRDHGERPVFFMECFRRELVRAACTVDEKCDCPCEIPAHATTPSASISMARAAIADFLFHYKMSQQYPHEFNPYDLTQSADAMNRALRPFIDEFNKDVQSYQQIFQYVMNAKTHDKRQRQEWFGVGDGPSQFNYNTLVSVHSISGSEAIVDTTTESYLDTMSTPTLSGLLNSINSALPTGGGGGSTGATTTSSTATVSGNTTTTTSTTQPVNSSPSAPKGVLANLSLNQAQVLMGAVGAFQSTPAHIGRETLVDVLPESLSGASSAELQVGLRSADSANPPSYVVSGPLGGSSTDPQVSRFSNSTVSTRIRVDSVKMFEVASFSAELYYARKNIPILPVPLVQLPYVGSVLSWKVSPAREYHSSVAVMSAIIIPTATDLATGIRFVADRLVEPPPLSQPSGCYWPPYSQSKPPAGFPHLCQLRPAISITDFANQTIREFHRKMVQCLATGSEEAQPNLLPHSDATGRAECGNLTFAEVPNDAN